MSKPSAQQPLRLVANPITHPTYVLDEQQQAAIAHRGAPLLLFGAAGTGKTTTLIEAAIDRVKTGSDPESILILAFGRERASEIRDAIVIAANGTVQEPVARTFHALAFSILSMRSGDTFRETVLISGAEQESFIASLLRGNIDDGVTWWPADLRASDEMMGEPLLTQGFVRELRDLIMRATERGLTPEELADMGQRLQERYWPAVAQFWDSYLKISATSDTGAADSKMRIDPAEIINAAIAHLKRNPDLLASLRQRFTTIMVDEFHESDPAQRRLLELLHCQDMVFVLDPACAIGRFRGADPDGSVQYCEKTFSDQAKKITLATNHRGQPNKFVVQLLSESEEAQYIAYQCKRAHLIEGVAYADMAIILRSHNTTATAIRRALAQSAIPVAGDREALSSSAALAPFLLLARVAAGSERLTLDVAERLLTAEFGGASTISMRRIRTALLKARDENLDTRSGSQMIIDAIDKGDLPKGSNFENGTELLRVHNLLASARAALRKKSASIHDLLWAIWSNAENGEGTKIADLWQAAALRGGARGAAADRDLDAMVALFDSAARHIDRMPGAHPKIFLEEVAQENIVTDLITAKGIRPDVVNLLTVHSVKGLQFKRVFVAGIQEGIWPNLKERSTLLGAERLVERERHGEEQSVAALTRMTADSLSEDEKRLFHVATTRATEELHLTAITREDDSPSQYFLDATDDASYVQRKFDDVRPLTASALVASLRRSLMTSKAEEAASLLATLSQADIAIADPENWLGSRSTSTDAPLFSEDELVPISPSAAESFEECGLKWLLERNGGSNGDSVAQLLGSVIHEYARLKVEGADMSDEALQQSLDDAWPLITDSSGWISKVQLARASKMLQRFAQYHRENPNVVEGVEMKFDFTLGRAKVRGSVDRLEVDSDGKFFVVDFKTGKATGHDAASENIQLACYQLAVILNAFEKKFDNPQVSGSHLVFLGHETKEIATRERAPIIVDEISTHLQSVAQKMSTPVFIARENDFCATCPVRPSCPLHLEGRTVIG